MEELIWDQIDRFTEDAHSVFERLQDDESKKLFEMRYELMLENPYIEPWINKILPMYKDWHPEKIIDDNRDSIVIYGCGKDGILISRILKAFGIEPICFCISEGRVPDNNIEGTPVVVINEMLGKKNVLYLIASSRYRHEIFHNLVGMGVDKGSIYVPPEKYITGIRGNQYFDVFAPNESEVFVDAGAFDGSTVKSFLKWAGDKVRQVYAIEPLGEMCDCIQNKFLDMRCVEVVNGGVWDKSGEILKFNDNGPSTSLGLNGQMQVSTIAIDDLTDKNPPTFIKMDIEGAEYKALKGAEKTIRKYKPRLAICVYHKPNDIVRLGGLILRMVPEYRFWIRHYTADFCETVLYASV